MVCVLVGLPGSGKSTFARDVLLKPGFRKLIFSYDDIQFVEGIEYKMYRQKVRDRLERFIQDEKDIDCDHPTVVLVDDIMIYRSMRYEIFSLARKWNLNGFCQIFLDTDLQTCILRNIERGSVEVTEEMIRNQVKRLEPPGKGNSQMDKFVLEIKDNSFNPEDVQRLIHDAVESGIPAWNKKMDNPPVNQSAVHQIDIILRKHIGLRISKAEGAAAKRLLAEELNTRRNELLQDIRIKTLVFEEPFQEVIQFM